MLAGQFLQGQAFLGQGDRFEDAVRQGVVGFGVDAEGDDLTAGGEDGPDSRRSG